MKCIAIERSRLGYIYTVTVEKKVFWIFKGKCKYRTVQPLKKGFEWMQMPNANKVSPAISKELDLIVEDYKLNRSCGLVE